MFAVACGASVGAGSGNSSTIARDPRRDQSAEDCRRKAQGGGQRLAGGPRLGAAQPGAHTDQQSPRQSAAEGGLGQRDIGCRETQPDQREQQAIGDKTDNRGERVACGNGPGAHADHQEGEADIESQAAPLCLRPARPSGVRNQLSDRGSSQQGKEPDAD